MRGPHRSAPDYTVACLWMGFVNLFMVFVALWAIWGLIASGLMAYAVHLGINQMAFRKAAKEAASQRYRNE
ncbi:MAG: hypothetical protein ACU0A2_06905 [Cognatishimia sp.]|uniref:hypothetical protein n=1 Tax=Cognatishimia sp. TaxID=2211648 RepID=UPI004059CD78